MTSKETISAPLGYTECADCFAFPMNVIFGGGPCTISTQGVRLETEKRRNSHVFVILYDNEALLNLHYLKILLFSLHP